MSQRTDQDDFGPGDYYVEESDVASGANFGDRRYSPSVHQATHHQAAHDDLNFIDGAETLFTMYLERAGEHDKKMTDGWKGDADGILVFTGLFSASVATFLGISLQSLQPNSQDTSTFYLANIYQVLSDSNGSHVPIFITPPSSSDPTAFSPPASAVWVNVLWFMSLVISLTCALLATLLQRWARRYLQITQPRYSLRKRQRIRAFYFEGVEKHHLPWVVEALPALLHVSLFLFFAGLVVFLFNINHTVFSIVISWVGICVGMYTYITFMPIFRHDSPFNSPLSSSAWFCTTGIYFMLSRILEPFNRFRVRTWKKSYGFERWFHLGTRKVVEDTALEPPTEIDDRALVWTLESLDEDHELEHFFAALPSFSTSGEIWNPLSSQPNAAIVALALLRWIDRTLSPINHVQVSVKQRRVVICTRALYSISSLSSSLFFDRVIQGFWREFLECAEYGRLALWESERKSEEDPIAAFHARCVLSIMTATVRGHGEWFPIVRRHLGVSALALDGLLDNGDSVLLANLIRVIEQMIDYFPQAHEDVSDVVRDTLKAVSWFDALDVSRELQHRFYTLWNRLVLITQNPEGAEAVRSLTSSVPKNIRHIYSVFHTDTDGDSMVFLTDDRNPVLDYASYYPQCSGVHVHYPVNPSAVVRVAAMVIDVEPTRSHASPWPGSPTSWSASAPPSAPTPQSTRTPSTPMAQFLPHSDPASALESSTQQHSAALDIRLVPVGPNSPTAQPGTVTPDMPPTTGAGTRTPCRPDSPALPASDSSTPHAIAAPSTPATTVNAHTLELHLHLDGLGLEIPFLAPETPRNANLLALDVHTLSVPRPGESSLHLNLQGTDVPDAVIGDSPKDVEG